MPATTQHDKCINCHWDCSQNSFQNPLVYNSSSSAWQLLDLGCMNVPCPFCRALHWKAESSGRDPGGQEIFEGCCKKGSVELELLPSLLSILCNLFFSNSSSVKCFCSNICQYNTALAYILFVYTPDPRLHFQEYIYMFQLQEVIYHWQGSLYSSNPFYS